MALNDLWAVTAFLILALKIDELERKAKRERDRGCI